MLILDEALLDEAVLDEAIEAARIAGFEVSEAGPFATTDTQEEDVGSIIDDEIASSCTSRSSKRLRSSH